MWITFNTATDREVLDDESKKVVEKGLRLLILVGNEDEALIASRLLHIIVPIHIEPRKKPTSK